MSGRPRSRRRPELGQHFLRSDALAASLVAKARLDSSDLVVEIGPGRGALTRALARRCARVIAVELDPELCRALRRELGAEPRVEVVQGDFLDHPRPPPPYKVFGSVPYARTASIVRELTRGPAPPDDAFLVVQREAALRLAGRPRAPESQLSLSLRPWWQVEIVRALRRTDFAPPPRVDSVLLWLARRTRPLVCDAERSLYLRCVRSLFGGGGDIGRALRPFATRRQLDRLGRELRFDPAGPPSALSFDQWLAVFRFVADCR